MASKLTNIFIAMLFCPCMNVFSMSRDTSFFKYALEAALKDDATIGEQKLLGDYYKNGGGIERAPKKAFEWYMKAAIRGDAASQYEVAILCENGDGVEKNPEQAFEWMLKAAQQRYALAQHKVGNFYAKGFGVERDLESALEWYLKAVKEVDVWILASYQLDLGKFYEEEIGDPWKAFMWYLKAAKLGARIATHEVIRCYENGIGVEKSHEKAVEWSHENGYEHYGEIDKRLEALLEEQVARLDEQLKIVKASGLWPK